MFVFDHIGITTTIAQANENWVEQSRVWVTNPHDHPEHIEFLRYAEGTTVPDIIIRNPHVAYRVDDIGTNIKGQEILIPPFIVWYKRNVPKYKFWLLFLSSTSGGMKSALSVKLIPLLSIATQLTPSAPGTPFRIFLFNVPGPPR